MLKRPFHFIPCHVRTEFWFIPASSLPRFSMMTLTHYIFLCIEFILVLHYGGNWIMMYNSVSQPVICSLNCAVCKYWLIVYYAMVWLAKWWGRHYFRVGPWIHQKWGARAILQITGILKLDLINYLICLHV